MVKSKKNMRPGEKELIHGITRAVSYRDVRPRGTVVGIGDDAAVVRCTDGQKLILTTDIQVENVHFRRAWFTGRELGWRLAAVNLSDIAAMGGRPSFALLSLAIPWDMEADYIKAVAEGAARHLSRYGAKIVGGNISGSEKHLVCDLTLTGACETKEIWRRHCRPGRDAIVVVGRLGSARAGLELLKKPGATKYPSLVKAYKKPRPLLDVARMLRNEPAVHGAIDVSDGFSTDLIRICEQSDAGCRVNAADLPIERSLIRFCREHGRDPVDWAMRGGEDYALVLSVAAGRSQALVERVRTKLDLPARIVGRFTACKGRYELAGRTGEVKKFTPAGWDHFAR